MDIDQLRYFVTAAETLNFTEAARRHFISQPAISSQISALERSLKVKLFRRSSHQVRLTEAGRAFYDDAADILERLEAAQVRAANIAEGRVGRIAVATLAVSPSRLGRCLSAFYQRCPEVQVDLSFFNGREMTQALQEESFDLYFAVEGLFPARHQMEQIVMERSPFCLILPREEAGRVRPGDLSALRDRPFIGTARGEGPVLHDQVLQICRSLRYVPRVVNLYNRADSVLISVAAGMGVSVLPASIVEHWPRDEVAVIPLDTPQKMVSVAARRRDCANPAALRFWELVGELFPPEPGLPV